MADLDDTRRCPHAESCESCGSTDEFGVTTLDTSIGVYCVTLCPGCVTTGTLPRLSVTATAARVAEHCQHLGITLDEAAALHDEENDRG